LQKSPKREAFFRRTDFQSVRNDAIAGRIGNPSYRRFTSFQADAQEAIVAMSVETLATLVLLLLVASITDIRSWKIYNWNTYPGILLGIGLRWIEEGQQGMEDSIKGFFVCGFLMLICYILFHLVGAI
jgi:hypothetical protein